MAETDQPSTGLEVIDRRDPNTAERFVLIIRPSPSGRDKHDRDPMYRLGLLLKRMLRSYGWRCESVLPKWLDDERKSEDQNDR